MLTVTDNANAQGLLATYEVGISYAPASSDSDPNGELTFGGVDTSKFTGKLHSVYVFFLIRRTSAEQPVRQVYHVNPAREFLRWHRPVDFLRVRATSHTGHHGRHHRHWHNIDPHCIRLGDNQRIYIFSNAAQIIRRLQRLHCSDWSRTGRVHRLTDHHCRAV